MTTSVDVPGNVHKLQFRSFWHDIFKAPEFMMKTLEEGYELPFHTIPPESFEAAFVREEVKRLEALGCIKRVKHRPRCVLPLSSVFSKKKHLIFDGSSTSSITRWPFRIFG